VQSDALYEFLKAENERLYAQKQKDLKDPFSYEIPGINLSTFGITDNLIGFLTIPRIEETLPLYLGANEQNMTKGAVHLTQTSYPIGGNNTNVVIAAHRGYYQANMFRHIDKLEIGDNVYIKNFRETLTYQVVETKIINPDAINEVLIREQRDMITLLSCHPYMYNYKRYVVYCERVNN
ncbi:class C sortase, partial [Lachnospiraceae bacterium OttesenSCG-928-J05]|nr:class C sortase [Lachnospiraceae bacterium OttesenSCG-928-J05]